MKWPYSIFIICGLLICSCEDNSAPPASSNNNNGGNNSTPLEGIWLLQNIQNGARLTFQGQNWRIDSGTVTITGTFTVTNDLMNCVVLTRSGANNGGLQPDTFSGNFSISNNVVTFTNFTGNWYAVFSTWYVKIG